MDRIESLSPSNTVQQASTSRNRRLAHDFYKLRINGIILRRWSYVESPRPSPNARDVQSQPDCQRSVARWYAGSVPTWHFRRRQQVVSEPAQPPCVASRQKRLPMIAQNRAMHKLCFCITYAACTHTPADVAGLQVGAQIEIESCDNPDNLKIFEAVDFSQSGRNTADFFGLGARLSDSLHSGHA